MRFRVKEIFFTLQGEGVQAGCAALFCRFSGCNLWTGKEADRSKAACTFCDTDFTGTNGSCGGLFADEETLVNALIQALPLAHTQNTEKHRPLIVLTGGEPALQITPKLIELLHSKGFRIAIETNGSLPLPEGIDWICVSPKTGVPLTITQGDELKLVWPQEHTDIDLYLTLDFKHHILQPCDNANISHNTKICMDHCLTNPAWRLGLQIHKFLGIE